MGAIARLGEFENRATCDHFATVANERLQQFLQRQQLRLTVEQRDHVDAEHRFHRRLREQVVQHDFGVLAAAQLDDDAHAVLVGLIAQTIIRDAFELLVADEIRDALDQTRLVDLIRQLCDDDGLTVRLADVLEVRARTDGQPTATGLVGRRDFLRAIDDPGRREVRTGHMLHQPGEADVGIIDDGETGVDDFREIVRRDVRRHADGDTG